MTVRASEPTASTTPIQRRPVSATAGLFTVGLAALFGANPTAIKQGLEYVGPLQIAWLRFFLGGLTILAWALLTRRNLRLQRAEVVPILGLSVLFVLMISATNIGQDYTTAAHTTVIISAFPIWTALFSHLVVAGDRMGRPQVIGMALSYAGVVATFAPSLSAGGAALGGDALVFVASILLGATQVYIAVYAQRIELAKLILSQAAAAVVLLLPVSALVEGTQYDLARPLLLSLVYQGVIVGGLAFIANAWLLQKYVPSRISVIYATQPLFGIVAGWWVLGEPIGPEVIAGGVLVMLGILMVQEVWTSYRRAPAEAA